MVRISTECRVRVRLRMLTKMLTNASSMLVNQQNVNKMLTRNVFSGGRNLVLQLTLIFSGILREILIFHDGSPALRKVKFFLQLTLTPSAKS